MSSLFTKSSLASVLTNSSSSSSNNNTKTTQQAKNASATKPHEFASKNNGNNLNNSYLKTIDNCLEEASRTGDLLLSNKSLIEFPSTIAFKYDLTDTLFVDLSKNRLSEFPKDVLRYKPLEKLDLNSNIIKSIPEINASQLRCIKVLDLNCNRLTYLPPSVCNLVSLEILTVCNNKLVSLPEEIGRLDKLIQLDVSCNEITHLPAQIGEMSSLRALNVRRNLLVELPKDVSQLKLVHLDFSSNRISKLPLCFRDMITLIDLVVDNNPLELPPAHVCTKGLLHIMKYLLVETIKEEKRRGVLSEHEINSPHQLGGMSGSAQQRGSCNSCNGFPSLGSLIFQSSMRNMCKNFSDTQSNSSSASSTSSASCSSLSVQLGYKSAKSNNTKPQFVNKHDSAIPISNSNANVKQNIFLNNDYLSENQSPPLTSSPSSSSCSSPPSIGAPKMASSIHDLISCKSPLDINQNPTKSESTDPAQNDQIWRLTSNDARKSYDENSYNNNNNKQKQRSQFDASFSMVAGLSSSTQLLTPTTSKTSLIDPRQTRRIEHQSEHRQNTLNYSSSKQQSEPTTMHGHVIYDESLNPIMLVSDENNDLVDNGFSNLAISIESTADSTSADPSKFYYYQQQQQQQQQQPPQQQMVWIPRDDFYSNKQMKELANDFQNPAAFTIRRHIIQIQEEQKLIEALKKCIESRVRVQLPSASCPDELGAALSDGVLLCHFVNQIVPRSLQLIHVPSLGSPKLSLAKCRKNVENFIEACRRIGLPENDLCCAHDIIEAKNTSKVARTVLMLTNWQQCIQENIAYESRHANNFANNMNTTTIGAVMSKGLSLPPAQSIQQQQQQQQQTAV